MLKKYVDFLNISSDIDSWFRNPLNYAQDLASPKTGSALARFCAHPVFVFQPDVTILLFFS